LFLGHHRRSN